MRAHLFRALAERCLGLDVKLERRRGPAARALRRLRGHTVGIFHVVLVVLVVIIDVVVVRHVDRRGKSRLLNRGARGMMRLDNLL